MKIVERLELFIEHLVSEKRVTSVAHFEKVCDIYRGYVSNQKRSKGFLDGEQMQKIKAVYPELNLNWLVTGVGEMVASEGEPTYKDAYDAAMTQIVALNNIIAQKGYAEKITPKNGTEGVQKKQPRKKQQKKGEIPPAP